VEIEASGVGISTFPWTRDRVSPFENPDTNLSRLFGETGVRNPKRVGILAIGKSEFLRSKNRDIKSLEIPRVNLNRPFGEDAWQKSEPSGEGPTGGRPSANRGSTFRESRGHTRFGIGKPETPTGVYGDGHMKGGHVDQDIARKG
jgi:hypothetical protein